MVWIHWSMLNDAKECPWNNNNRGFRRTTQHSDQIKLDYSLRENWTVWVCNDYLQLIYAVVRKLWFTPFSIIMSNLVCVYFCSFVFFMSCSLQSTLTTFSYLILAPFICHQLHFARNSFSLRILAPVSFTIASVCWLNHLVALNNSRRQISLQCLSHWGPWNLAVC